jgi:hypothetical protein
MEGRFFFHIIKTLVRCKKYINLSAWISAVRSKKQHISFPYTTDFRVVRSSKTCIFHVKALHFCCALLKIKTIKSLYILDYKR